MLLAHRTTARIGLAGLTVASMALDNSIAFGEESSRVRAAAGASLALSPPQSTEFGWGTTASAAAELPVRRFLAATLSAEALYLSAARPPPPPFAPQGSGRAAFFLLGLRGYPLSDRPDRLRPWLSLGAGYCRTGDSNRIAAAADLGLDIPAGRFTSGPFLGFRHVLQPDSELRPADANLGVFGVQGSLGFEKPKPPPPENPDFDGDKIINSRDACPRQAEDFDGFEDQDGCPDTDNDRDTFPDPRDKCPNEAEDRDGFEDTDGCPDLDNDQDTILDKADKCPDRAEDFDGFEDTDGCPDEDNDADGLADKVDQCPDEAETKNGYLDDDGCPDADSVSVIAGRILLNDAIYFTPESATIESRSTSLVRKLAALLIQHPEFLLVSIEGHCDDRGSDEYNQRLSDRRANAVKTLLITDGVERARLTAVGFGKSRPIVTAGPGVDTRKNRRVEFYIAKQRDVPRAGAVPKTEPADRSKKETR